MQNKKFKLVISVFSILCIVFVSFGFAILSGKNPKDALFSYLQDDSSKSEASSSTSRPAPPAEDSIKLILKVTDYGNVPKMTKSIDKNIMIKNEGNEPIYLSKVKIRYYYTRESDCEQKVNFDGAIFSYNRKPWYENVEKNVVCDISNVKNKYCYCDIFFKDIDTMLEPLEKINIFVRILNKDKTLFNQENDYSYNSDNKVTLYYDSKVAFGDEMSDDDMK